LSDKLLAEESVSKEKLRVQQIIYLGKSQEIEKLLKQQVSAVSCDFVTAVIVGDRG
jgi:hypothetical protein